MTKNPIDFRKVERLVQQNIHRKKSTSRKSKCKIIVGYDSLLDNDSNIYIIPQIPQN
jgi:hypothetical protein